MSKYALCMGNNYPGTDAELQGCVNDAQDWEQLLRGEGYEITVLTEATKAEAVRDLTEMVGRAKLGDRVVFTYSGHGSWVPDRSGDEADGRDECLVMTDYQAGGLLLDDELQEIFDRLSTGAGALILSDSCHSGTVARMVMETAETVAAVPRFLPPSEFLDISTEEAVRREEVPASAPRKTASLISGCADTEYSYDAHFGSRANGAFTYHALDAYEDTMTLSRWYRAIRRVLPSAEYPQTPQLTAQSTYRRYLTAL